MRFRRTHCVRFVLLFFLVVALHAQEKIDSSPHTIQMVSVGKGVSLEVLDWGRHWQTAGSANLHLNKPVIAGHSIAGEELSYIGSHHPEKVAGLIYLEAGYPYALYDQANGELELDAIELRKQLRQFTNGYAQEPVKDYDELIANLERVEREAKKHQQDMGNLPPTPVSPRMTPGLFAIMEGRETFTTIHVPALVIFAIDPSPISGDDPQAHAQAVRQALMIRDKNLQIAAWKRQVPSAHMVLIPHATHYVFKSNEADVLREMNNFIATLPAAK